MVLLSLNITSSAAHTDGRRCCSFSLSFQYQLRWQRNSDFPLILTLSCLTNEVHSISLHWQSFFTHISVNLNQHNPGRSARRGLLSPMATTGVTDRTNPWHWMKTTSLKLMDYWLGAYPRIVCGSCVCKGNTIRTTTSHIRARCYLPSGAELHILRPVARCSLWLWNRTVKWPLLVLKGCPWPQKEASWLICSSEEMKMRRVVVL